MVKRASYYFSIYRDHASGNTPETVVNNYISKELFHQVMSCISEFTNVRETVFIQPNFIREYFNSSDDELQSDVDGFDFMYILDYDPDRFRGREVKVDDFYKYSYVRWGQTVWAELYFGENYRDTKILYNIAQALGRNLLTYDKLIDESYLEALRIKEENRGIKLTRDQRNVLDSIDRECRWLHVPTEETDKVLALLGISQELKESEITDIIASVQEKNEVVVSTFMGHTVLMGLQLPYALYADGSAYEANEGQHGEYLNKTLSLLSKEFGSAEYFEYNEEDSQVASLSLSKKGKLVYACFSSEGKGKEIFGTRKKSMEVNRATILKTSGKLGITPEDHFTLVMKQKQKVRHFTQPNWAIESMIKRYGGETPIGDN